MSFRLTKANCVAAGTFNMYIVQPDWLARMEIIPAQQEFPLEVAVDAPGLRFSIPERKERWNVTPTYLVVEGEEPDVDCGKPVADVLDKLSHTPVSAIGCNFTFEVETPESLADFSCCPKLPAPEGFALSSRGCRFSLQKEDLVYNVFLDFQDKKTIVSVNIHLALSRPNIQRGLDFARSFEEQRKTAEQIVAELP